LKYRAYLRPFQVPAVPAIGLARYSPLVWII
jgi:hypothetical protein